MAALFGREGPPYILNKATARGNLRSAACSRVRRREVDLCGTADPRQSHGAEARPAHVGALLLVEQRRDATVAPAGTLEVSTT